MEGRPGGSPGFGSGWVGWQEEAGLYLQLLPNPLPNANGIVCIMSWASRTRKVPREPPEHDLSVMECVFMGVSFYFALVLEVTRTTHVKEGSGEGDWPERSEI